MQFIVHDNTNQTNKGEEIKLCATLSCQITNPEHKLTPQHCHA